jgi:hypothetical protein
VRVSFGPLVYVSGLTLGDYLLWSWSLNHHHDVISVVAGLSLPVLGAACVWLLVVAVTRFIADRTSAPARRARRRSGRGTAARRPGAGRGSHAAEGSAAHGSSNATSSDKLAA